MQSYRRQHRSSDSDKEQRRQHSPMEPEGAVSKRYFIEAEQQPGQWQKARILACRCANSKCLSSGHHLRGCGPYLTVDLNLAPRKMRKATETTYEYYVHYEGTDKRLDEWISGQRVRQTNQRISDMSRFKNQPIKSINCIQLGRFKFPTWYFSPYPKNCQSSDCLYVCDFCLNACGDQSRHQKHIAKCPTTCNCPPGQEIYRDQTAMFSVFEVDPSQSLEYCQNLCLLSKLFLDCKLLEADTTLYMFYVLCQYDQVGWRIVGYFSKEKNTASKKNLACIMVLPCHQKKGYGKFLISFSYQLMLLEGRVGSPERPFSDLGRASFLAWWTQRIIDFIRKNRNKRHGFSIEDISKATAIMQSDILWTLKKTSLIETHGGQPQICMDEQFLKEKYDMAGRPARQINRRNLRWVPQKSQQSSNTRQLRHSVSFVR